MKKPTDKISSKKAVSVLLSLKELISSIFKGELSREEEEIKSLIEKSIDVAINAIYQKDKSKIVKIPYKIGSKVWVIDSYDGYTGYIFLGCNENYAFLGSGINGSFDVDDICQYGYEEFQYGSQSAYIVPLKDVFLTKESAEQALRERETK